MALRLIFITGYFLLVILCLLAEIPFNENPNNNAPVKSITNFPVNFIKPHFLIYALWALTPYLKYFLQYGLFNEDITTPFEDEAFMNNEFPT